MLWHGKNFRGFLNKAKEVIFDNTGTTLQSTNAEDAIKEVNSNLSIVDIHDYTDTGATSGGRSVYSTSLPAGTYIVTSFSDVTTGEDSIATHSIQISGRAQTVRFNTVNGGGSVNVMIFRLSTTDNLTITGYTSINQIFRNQTVVLKVKG